VYTFDVDGSMLYLSVAGRETNGTLPPSRYAEVREEIRRRILAARDPETGECPVTRVLTREEAFHGRYTEKGPDLLLVPRPGVFVASVKEEQPIFGPPQFTFSAHHESNGILIARGPRLRSGTVGKGPSLLDVAPTVLYLLDLPVPSNMEGSVLTGLVRPEWLREHPVRKGPALEGGGEETPLTPEEKERLQSVPYIR
jgi:predicted AlkP superfamily phosphohydrolase/phosphomutase